jgi:multidrug efflux pump subunit AcrA (membrane-fusion protein)
LQKKIARRAADQASFCGRSVARERRARRAGLAERARDATVVAPSTGWSRSAGARRYVAPGAPLVELVALDRIEISFHVTEIDSARVNVGATVDLRVATYPDESFQGQVISVSPGVDLRTRMLRVRAVVPNADRRLRPGFFARVDLGISERETPMIPEDAAPARRGRIPARGSDRVERRAAHRRGATAEPRCSTVSRSATRGRARPDRARRRVRGRRDDAWGRVRARVASQPEGEGGTK